MMKGTVKWFEYLKGFGFIKGEDGEDYFVHRTSIETAANLDEDTNVTFRPSQTRKGLSARNVNSMGKSESTSYNTFKAEKADEEDRQRLIEQYDLKENISYVEACAEAKEIITVANEFRGLIDRQFFSSKYQENSDRLIDYIQKRHKLSETFGIDTKTRWEIWMYDKLESLESKLEEDPFKDVKPIVAKRDREYSLLLIDDSTDEYVQIYEINSEDGLTKLIETNGKRPMKVESVKNSFKAELIDFLKDSSEFYDNCKFIRSDGIPINLDSKVHERCEEIFENVNNGIEIFPYKKGVTKGAMRRGYSVNSTREQRDPIYRTEGQRYLKSMDPDEIIEGLLLGDGDIAIAFVFGDNVIIEAKDLGKATYVTEKEEFDTIRCLPRWTAMKLTQEDGLMDRIFHEDVDGETFDFEKWKEKIIPYLGVR
jgi:CspA family cold shock protein